MDMKLAQAAVDAALSAGADYADARVNHTVHEELSFQNGEVAAAESPEDSGVGIRVMKDGCWGFAAASVDDESGVRELGKRALRVANELSPARSEPIRLAPLTSGASTWETPYELDPFDVSLSDKLDLLKEAEASMAGAEETVVKTAEMSCRREEQWMASSDGAELYQNLLRCGAGISTTSSSAGCRSCCRASAMTRRRMARLSSGSSSTAVGPTRVMRSAYASRPRSDTPT